MNRKEELNRLFHRLAEISGEAVLNDCPEEKRLELRREISKILARIDELEDQRLREKAAAMYPDGDALEKK